MKGSFNLCCNATSEVKLVTHLKRIDKCEIYYYLSFLFNFTHNSIQIHRTIRNIQTHTAGILVECCLQHESLLSAIIYTSLSHLLILFADGKFHFSFSNCIEFIVITDHIRMEVSLNSNQLSAEMRFHSLKYVMMMNTREGYRLFCSPHTQALLLMKQS